jgi:signal transduction histidine kinase
VYELGYRRAVIGLYDDALDTLSGWITLDSDTNGHSAKMSHVDLVSLRKESGPLTRAIKGKLVVEIINGEGPTAVESVNRRLVVAPHYIILPLNLRGITVGVIIVDRLPPEQRLSQTDRLSLDNLATHAGVALGSMRLCIDRAQQAAITEERNRIAVDLHDNVSQMLYGLAYGLDACSQILPGSHQIQSIIGKLHGSVTETQATIRQTIFSMRSHDVSSDTFVGGLHRRLRMLCPDTSTALRIDLPGEFDRWPADTRNQLFQVAGEALTNAAKHAYARHIVIRLINDDHDIEMRVSDDGDGFDPTAVRQSKHLGLHSMRERVTALNGKFEISSTYGEGTLITVKVPQKITRAIP